MIAQLYLLLTLLFPAVHPFHVAVCELNQNPKAGTVELTHKIFIDDLEKAVEKSTGKNLLLGNPKEHPDAKQLIGNYVVQHFLLKIDGQVLKSGYVGFETDNDQVFVYFEGRVKGKPKKLEITYTPFNEVFDDQSNIVHLKFGNVKQSLYLHKNKPTDTVSL
ncbi:MAG: DUF6702 family protein [Bacteroidota bacterium]